MLLIKILLCLLQVKLEKYNKRSNKPEIIIKNSAINV